MSELKKVVIEDSDSQTLEIIGSRNLYALHKYDKGTKKKTRIFVDGGTNFKKFKKDCEKFKTKK